MKKDTYHRELMTKSAGMTEKAKLLNGGLKG